MALRRDAFADFDPLAGRASLAYGSEAIPSSEAGQPKETVQAPRPVVPTVLVENAQVLRPLAASAPLTAEALVPLPAPSPLPVASGPRRLDATRAIPPSWLRPPPPPPPPPPPAAVPAAVPAAPGRLAGKKRPAAPTAGLGESPERSRRRLGAST